MAEKTDEQLSALVDGECDKAELELALRRCAKDDYLKERWQRYHLIGDAIRNYLPESIDTTFSKRVMQAIDDEPAVKTSVTLALVSWYKPLAGFGLAASVALISVFSLDTGPSEEKVRIADHNAINNPVPIEVARDLSADANAQDDWAVRFNDYLVNHNEYASTNSLHGVLPYMNLVDYQTDP